MSNYGETLVLEDTNNYDNFLARIVQQVFC